jgi:predicted negative regulator of RcsB-dependent stress response
MEAQETTTLYFLKLWQWIEAHKTRLIAGAAVLVVVIFFISFHSYRSGQREIAAGRALTQLSVTPGGAAAAACLKIADEFPGTVAGQRALLQGAALLFEAGKYTEAAADFNKFLDANPRSVLASQAALGLATSLDVQGKPASTEFQAVINMSSDPAIVSAAKFALGRIKEAQGKLDEARTLFEDVARANPGSSLGYEAGLHILQLRDKMLPPTPSPAPGPAPSPAPFTLTPAKPGS